MKAGSKIINRFRPKSGFTLIEMLVVVAVIGILVATTSYHNARVLKNSKDAALKHELSLLRSAVYQFMLHKGRFPEALKELEPDFINKVPETWHGSNAFGHFNYDRVEGSLRLASSEPGTFNLVDAGGRKYADY
jgi:prepilin-type N-terminal cleavage/methylation domain-containing protein